PPSGADDRFLVGDVLVRRVDDGWRLRVAGGLEPRERLPEELQRALRLRGVALGVGPSDRLALLVERVAPEEGDVAATVGRGVVVGGLEERHGVGEVLGLDGTGPETVE